MFQNSLTKNKVELLIVDSKLPLELGKINSRDLVDHKYKINK